MSVGRSHRDAKSYVVSAGGMLFESGEQFQGFAAIALKHEVA